MVLRLNSLETIVAVPLKNGLNSSWEQLSWKIGKHIIFSTPFPYKQLFSRAVISNTVVCLLQEGSHLLDLAGKETVLVQSQKLSNLLCFHASFLAES